MTETPKRKRFGWPTIVGLLITVPLVWWALRGIHFDEVMEHFRTARTVPFVGAILATVLVFPLRAVQWRALLERPGQRLRLAPIWHATAIGFSMNNLLPARAGEIARAYAARKLSGIPFATALTTIAIARVVDGVTLFLLLAIAAASGALPGGAIVAGIPVARILRAATVVFTALMVIALAAVHFPGAALGGTERLSRLVLPRSWTPRVIKTIERVLHGLEVLKNWRRLGIVFSWTLVLWCVNALGFWLCFLAFRLDVPWYSAFVLQSLVNFGLVIPSTPGFVGVFEAVTRASLAIYGVEPGAAISYAVAYHFCSYVPITLLGLWSLSRAHLHFSEIQEEVHERVSDAVQRMTGTHPRIDPGH